MSWPWVVLGLGLALLAVVAWALRIYRDLRIARLMTSFRPDDDQAGVGFDEPVTVVIPPPQRGEP